MNRPLDIATLNELYTQKYGEDIPLLQEEYILFEGSFDVENDIGLLIVYDKVMLQDGPLSAEGERFLHDYREMISALEKVGDKAVHSYTIESENSALLLLVDSEAESLVATLAYPLAKSWSVDEHAIIKRTYIAIAVIMLIIFLSFFVLKYLNEVKPFTVVGVIGGVWLSTIIQTMFKPFVYNFSVDTLRGVLWVDKINFIKRRKTEQISLSTLNTDFFFGKTRKQEQPAFILELTVQGKVHLRLKHGENGWYKEALQEIHSYIQVKTLQP